jgi:hypothetical protein
MRLGGVRDEMNARAEQRTVATATNIAGISAKTWGLISL